MVARYLGYNSWRQKPSFFLRYFLSDLAVHCMLKVEKLSMQLTKLAIRILRLFVRAHSHRVSGHILRYFFETYLWKPHPYPLALGMNRLS